MNKIGFITIVLLTLNTNLALASKVPGYIINNSSDTLFGEILVTRVNTYSGGIILFGINLGPFHSVVNFRENSKDCFKSFTPNDILEFGFTYKSTDYRFKTFVIESNSIIKSERNRMRFLNLIYLGEIAVYRDIVRKKGCFETIALTEKAFDYYDYYLFDDKIGLKRVVWTEEYKALVDLLMYYKMSM